MLALHLINWYLTFFIANKSSIFSYIQPSQFACTKLISISFVRRREIKKHLKINSNKEINKALLIALTNQIIGS